MCLSPHPNFTVKQDTYLYTEMTFPINQTYIDILNTANPVEEFEEEFEGVMMDEEDTIVEFEFGDELYPYHEHED